ncbi:hypothetical protein GCM10008955_38080 [Deinococcus malanensis]|uniref:Uncharacterized protein n=1 Tax=Deinococcus malanensis TaxID=1706855 RepID=A0ABQ2F263_9DEIO|nr:hypothetical protein [Deinococcus malanensis]GGK40692.1 hypothetical protein GCM10008955_38080 [Deinococcus malanensis]
MFSARFCAQRWLGCPDPGTPAHPAHTSARSQIQKVWRGERPQAGRYREFYQADIDVIGRGSLNLLYDTVLPAVANDALTRLDIGPFCIWINNRQVLQGYFKGLGLAPAAVPQALRVLDRLEKVGIDRVPADRYSREM